MKKKSKKETGDATRAGVKKEIDEGRMTKSTREGELNRVAGRTVPVPG
jgi:hypothetical protein